MAVWAKEGHPLQCEWKKVAAGQTTANISAPSDGVVGRDYLERVILTAASTAAPGAVSVFDGGTALLVHNVQITGYLGTNVTVYEVGVHAQTTAGFNVTTGTSISAVCVGIFA
jgi:hypothetical protein